jgi:hypothetical protein
MVYLDYTSDITPYPKAGSFLGYGSKIAIAIVF